MRMASFVPRRRQRSHPKSRGQTLVEFALILPIFLLMLFGLVDIGRLVYANTTLSNAARESARLAAVEAYWVGSSAAGCNQEGGPVCPGDVTAMRDDVVDAANRMMTPIGSVASADLHLSCTAESAAPPSGPWTSPTNNCNNAAIRQSANARVSVRIAMSFQPITPIIGQIISSIDLSGSATMTIN